MSYLEEVGAGKRAESAEPLVAVAQGCGEPAEPVRGLGEESQARVAFTEMLGAVAGRWGLRRQTAASAGSGCPQVGPLEGLRVVRADADRVPLRGDIENPVGVVDQRHRHGSAR
ncbi:hypothetical protein A4U64_09765 [Rhodococcus sp. WB1]|uniref:hypothetical protein n=1 Tax=unclassified Rhodococcus (in: high G+C Gram-positive bacteria) TaxID=192944 RepID=UPI00081A4B63|nr:MULTISPECIES: hypothetical protein [unclassified Rhodococcus (in: high G+C Gram-positive bacteria)]ANZ24944.1 hypothetical protein A4U64_09765 [Rhodococcus sp. WB1]USC13244.1 hypothetical protein KZJ41_16090 [Rhodococcus sp. 11-3]